MGHFQFSLLLVFLCVIVSELTNDRWRRQVADAFGAVSMLAAIFYGIDALVH